MANPNTESQAGSVRHSIDMEKLGNYLRSQREDLFSLPLQVKQFGHGQSNPSYLIIDAKNRKYVLRKQPPGALLAKSAHRVDREFHMLSALQATKVPVPKVYLLCQDKEVLNCDFYIMEFLQGRIFHEPDFPGVSSMDRTKMWHSAIETLANLHNLDVQTLGLPSQFTKNMQSHFPRQLKTLAMVAQAQAKAKNPNSGEELGPLPYVEQIESWMEQNMPTNRVSIVHGDYKIDNIVYHPSEPRVIGLLDWELCTVGHPLADLGNILQPYELPPNKVDKTKGMFKLDPSTPGIPSLHEQLNDYKELTGYDPTVDWQFARVFTNFRLSVIVHGVAARALRGQASSADAKSIASMNGVFSKLAYDDTQRKPEQEQEQKQKQKQKQTQKSKL